MDLMLVAATVCAIVASFLFLWSSFRKIVAFDQTSLGLFFLTLAFIFSGVLHIGLPALR